MKTVRAICHVQAALSSNDSKTLYEYRVTHTVCYMGWVNLDL